MMNDIFDVINKYISFVTDTTNETIIKEQLRKKAIEKKNCEEKEMFLDRLKIALNGYYVMDWTDNEAYCYEYKILLHKNQDILDDDIELMEVLNYSRFDLFLFISLLAPVYYITLTHTTLSEDKTVSNIELIDTNSYEDIVSKISCILDEMGYHYMEIEEGKQIISNAQTDLLGSGCVTMFDCLFTDYHPIEM